MKKFWEFKMKSGKTGELYLYGEISDTTWAGDEVTPMQFQADIDSLGDVDEINVYINSVGGDVFAGISIVNMLERSKAKINIFIDGLAASIASVIAMAGYVSMPENAMMMIHQPLSGVWGTANEMRKRADMLDKISEIAITSYLKKAKNITREKLIALLDAETWLTAQQCKEYGFCDKITAPVQMVACVSDKYKGTYKNIPQNLVISGTNEAEQRQEILNENKQFTQMYGGL